MSYLIVGSKALNHNLDYIYRESVDLDIICTYDYFKSHSDSIKSGVGIISCYPLSGSKYVLKAKCGSIVEYDIAWEDGSSNDMILEIESEGYASLEMLYMLKMSHRFRKNSPHFKKTMDDIIFLRDKIDYNKVFVNLVDVYNKRTKETYDYKHPSLKQSKKDFFSDDGIDYKYDHDSIHLSVAELFFPAYTYIKDDTTEVEVSKDKFDKAHWRTKLLTVVEEAMVLAIERSLVPHPKVLTPEKAFEYALMKVCTSITSGWWRDYAWENYYQALEYFNTKRIEGWKYEEVFHKAVVDGVVIPFNKQGEI